MTIYQIIHLGKEGSPCGRLMRQCSESWKEAARLTLLLIPRTTAKVATRNIRTMYETGKTIRVAREMKSYKIGVLGLSETRRLQSGQLRLSLGEQLLYSGHIEDGTPPPCPPAQYWGCGPDAGTGGTWGTHLSSQPSWPPRRKTSGWTSSSAKLPPVMQKMRRKITSTNNYQQC